MGMAGKQYNQRDQHHDELHISLELLHKIKIFGSKKGKQEAQINYSGRIW
jgi:hypothetical protein